jgi:peptide-methionine (S)-S-oxide reductase
MMRLVLALAAALVAGSVAAETRTAVFAGGCFWCMEPPYDHLDGVVSTTSGYAGGKTENPTYEQVSSGRTGHAESIRVEYDPTKVSYEKLLDVFWHNIDPFAIDAQFCDHGDQYRSAIFPADAEERRQAEASLAKISERFEGKKIATKIEDAGKFWPAEDYHQDYYIKNPLRYKFYRFNCGRDARLEQIWGPKAGS